MKNRRDTKIPNAAPKPENRAWDIFNQPIGFNSIKEILSKDISFSGKQDEVRTVKNLDQQTDDLLKRAEDIAQKQGISIEEALANFGIEISDDSDQDKQPANMKDNMLKSLDWEVSQTESSMSINNHDWIRRSSEMLEEIRKYLGDIEREMLVGILEKVKPQDSELAEKLILLNVLTRDQLVKLQERYEKEGGAFWRYILGEESIDISLFVEVLRTMPYAPLYLEGKGSFHEWMMDKGIITYRTFKQAKDESKDKVSLLQTLKDKRYLGKDQILVHISEFSGLNVFNSQLPKPLMKLAKALPPKWLETFSLAPLKVTAKELTLGVTCPLSEFMVQKLSSESKLDIKQTLMKEEKLHNFRLKILEKIAPDFEETAVSKPSSEGRIKDIVSSASAVNMVRQLFEGALDSRATDIHIDPEDAGAKVRFRIDGLLYEVMKMENDLSNEVASRIKILADLDITERRRPQDGHINITIKNNEYDMRIATVPTKHGERIGIRMVYAGNITKTMDDLGLVDKDYEKVKNFIKMPHGMILATGPVGSGKTTTLYSCLNAIDRKTHNVMSIEDPVEFNLEGANQVEVNYALQFGFVEGLRALLRQDPDTILVGEIRDEETARIAVRASMTGLLVFSTLHTNDSPGAITTLSNFNLPPHLIANSIVGVIAQRLLRKICPHCKTFYKPDPKELDLCGFKPAEKQKIKRLYKGKGCSKCFHSGYLDRTGVFEVMELTHKMRDAVLERTPEKSLRELAIKEGMRTLAMDGREKILNGEITTEEFLRVIRF